MAKTKLKEYQIYAKAVVLVGIPVKAESLEKALEASNTLKLDDAVKILPDVDHMDSTFETFGVYEPSGWSLK